MSARAGISRRAGVSRDRREKTEGACNGFRRQRSPRTRSGGGRPGRNSFGNQLQCVGKVGNELTEFSLDGLYRPAKVGPDLIVRGVPEGLGGGRPPLGLSSLSNSQDTPPSADTNGLTEVMSGHTSVDKRHGLNGISRKGKRFIGDFCGLTQQIKKRMALWTVNLPMGWYLELKETALWPLFQRRLIDLLTQHLVGAGDVALVLGVVELSPKRGEREGRPLPHLHIVTSGWGARGTVSYTHLTLPTTPYV